MSKKLNEVFGLSREVPLTYTSRPDVDNRFVEDIVRDKHIVIHGSSKQGKTCLRKYHLRPEDFLAVQCTRDLSKAKLYEMILKNAGVAMTVTSTATDSTTATSSGSGEVEGGVPWFGKAKVSVAAARATEGTTETGRQEFEIDLQDPNDIVRALTAAGFSKHIVLEDFHYLNEDVQRSLAQDLKAFYETSKAVFIIVGVWLEANRLLEFNGDLGGRVSTIDADHWKPEELRSVGLTGETLLNFKFAPGILDAIVAGCQGNVGVLQEVCHRLCESAQLFHTRDVATEIGTPEAVASCFREIADAQKVRYRNFLRRFSEGLNTTQLEMYRWIARVAVEATPEELRAGLRVNVIFQRVAAVHPAHATLQQNNVLQALERVATVQFRHKLQPVIFDFANSRLSVVDANFLLFVKTQSREDLLAMIGF